MGRSLSIRSAHGRNARPPRRIVAVAALAAAGVALAACNRGPRIDTQMLDRAGMDYGAVQQLKSLKISTEEIPEILLLRDAGFSDAECVEALQIYRGEGQPFRSDELVDMKKAGLADGTIFTIAKMNDFGRYEGELAAMHLAGLSDGIVLEVAKHRAERKPVLAGASLARLKNAGMRSSTLLELARRGVPDSEAASILAYRKRGASDKAILRHYSGS